MLVCLHRAPTLKQPIIFNAVVSWSRCAAQVPFALDQQSRGKPTKVSPFFFPLKKPKMAHGSDCPQQAFVESRIQLKQQRQQQRQRRRQQSNIKDRKSFQAPFPLCLRGNFCERNISCCCVAFCFVSAKAAVHRRKNLDWLWIAALPTESGTAPAERRGDERGGEESGLQCGIMFPQYSHNSPADISNPLCRVVVFCFVGFFFPVKSRLFH